MKRIGDILTRNKTPVVVKDGKSYKQVTIRTNYKGVVLRGSQDGSAILTKNQFAVSAGQFILSRIDARNGAFGIIPEELEGAIVTNDFLAFDINEDEVEREFFNVFLQSPIFLEACIKASRGNTNRKRVEENFFLNYEVNLPPLREQHTLIKQINQGRANIATAQKEITHQETLLAKLQQAILQEAIQGKLTADWRAAHPQAEPASQLLHRIQAEKARLIAAKQLRPEKPLPKITSAEIPFAIPKTWEWCRLGNLGWTQTGTMPDTTVPENFGNFIPFVKPADIDGNGITYEEKGLSERGLNEGRLIEANSIMMVCIGSSTGKVAVNDRPVSCNQQINAITFLDDVSEQCVEFILKSPYFQTALWAATKTGITPIINKSKWSGILIPLPPLAEQAAIVARVEALLGSSRLLAAEIAQTRTHAAHLLQAVLKEAFTPAA
jgi:type I restriction enzyme S subunit